MREDSPALRIALMQQFRDSKNLQKKKRKERLMTAACNKNTKTIKKSRKNRYFKHQTKESVHKMTKTWLNRGNLKKETESLLTATQIIIIINNYVETKIDNTQKNSKCRLCGDRGETVFHIIIESNKLA